MNKLTIFDTHCHLADEKYQDEDIEKIIQEAKKVGVKNLLSGQEVILKKGYWGGGGRPHSISSFQISFRS